MGVGAETTKLIHEHITVSGVNDDMEGLVLNADVIDDLMNGQDPKKAKKLAKIIKGRLGRHGSNPAIVERIVTDVDEIVRKVRFQSWQDTAEGKRLIRSSLRRALLKYQLHKDDDLFEKCFEYVEQYY